MTSSPSPSPSPSSKSNNETFIEIYDTTLRDGAQSVGINFTLEDKVAIFKSLDLLGIDYIEAGWPGANPLDTEFFKSKPIAPQRARLTAFGMTARINTAPSNDESLNMLINSGADAITIVGKCSLFQVKQILRADPERYIDVVFQSIRYLKETLPSGDVMFDAEHFFDGYKADHDFACSILSAAHEAGARCLILCDTNGGSSPKDIARTVAEVKSTHQNFHLGIHCHNDTDQGVACSMAGIEGGARHVQGTINGIGERCGNANLLSIIANIALKSPYHCNIDEERLKKLSPTSRLLDDLLNQEASPYLAFVGTDAFAHKGGLHASGMARHAKAYEHIDPAAVGNARKLPISSQAGQASIIARLSELGIDISSRNDAPEKIAECLAWIKNREQQGYSYDSAQASLDLYFAQQFQQLQPYFEVVRFSVNDTLSQDSTHESDAKIASHGTIEVNIGSRTFRSEASGLGPVNALDRAFRKIVTNVFPDLERLQLTDYAVRIMAQKPREQEKSAQKLDGTCSVTRVLIRHKLKQGDAVHHFATVGVSANVIQASFIALADSYNYSLWLMNTQNIANTEPSSVLLQNMVEVVG